MVHNHKSCKKIGSLCSGSRPHRNYCVQDQGPTEVQNSNYCLSGWTELGTVICILGHSVMWNIFLLSSRSSSLWGLIQTNTHTHSCQLLQFHCVMVMARILCYYDQAKNPTVWVNTILLTVTKQADLHKFSLDRHRYHPA